MKLRGKKWKCIDTVEGFRKNEIKLEFCKCIHTIPWLGLSLPKTWRKIKII